MGFKMKKNIDYVYIFMYTFIMFRRMHVDMSRWLTIEGVIMALTEKRLFKHGGSWAVDLPMPFAKEVSDMSVVIEVSPQGILIKPKTEIDTIEADPLFQQFVKAIAIDAMKNPDKLHDAQDVWDAEWTDLLKGVDVGQE